jgi:hypothetical protein
MIVLWEMTACSLIDQGIEVLLSPVPFMSIYQNARAYIPEDLLPSEPQISEIEFLREYSYLADE